jgi:hypothetical protein
MAEYVTCPTCGSKVLTADALLGRHVRCIGCGLRFVAAADPPAPPRPAPAPRPADFPLPAPPRFSGTEEDENEDRPFCPCCGRQVSWQAATCPHCGAEFDDEEPPPPARPPLVDVALPVRRDGEAHRGRLLFTLGAAAAVTGALSACSAGLLAVVSVPLGVAVWALATRDLRRMRDGSVDPAGRSLTRHGRSAAVAGVVFGLIWAGLYVLVFFR